jgi:zinc transport system permease protein
LFSYLFGSITTVTDQDLFIISVLGVVIIGTLVLLYKEFFSVALDEELAQVHGLPVRFINLLLVVMAALVVSLSIRIVGVLLIGALMVIPVITALQYGGSFKQTIWLAILFSLISVVSGLFLSYYLNLASGGTIIVIALIIFGLTLLMVRSER